MKKIKISSVIVLLLLIGAVSLVLYPTLSDQWNKFKQSQKIQSYEKELGYDAELFAKILAEARAYNEELKTRGIHLALSEEEELRYQELLNPFGDGEMGYVVIPKIEQSLIIGHETGEEVLQTGVGHIPGTSLPVGGEGTHSALSGHRGLPSARLFTDLDKMEVGDGFEVHVLDQVLYYEIDQIVTVLPEEIQDLSIVEGEDYCTLVTCTPYGINTHRLLLRGTRVN